MNINSVNTGMDVPTYTQVSKPKVNMDSEVNISQQVKKDPSYIPTVQERQLIKTIEQANQKLAGNAKEFNFSIHEKTKQIMIKIIDSETKEVIKEVPPEKILDMVATMCEMAGLFVDEKK